MGFLGDFQGSDFPVEIFSGILSPFDGARAGSIAAGTAAGEGNHCAGVGEQLQGSCGLRGCVDFFWGAGDQGSKQVILKRRCFFQNEAFVDAAETDGGL